MTVLVLPTGTSILENVRDRKEPPPGVTQQAAQDYVDDLRGLAEELGLKELESLDEEGFTYIRKQVLEPLGRTTAGAVTIRDWLPHVSAETSSTASLTGRRDWLDDAERVVLLASDTEDGLLSAVVLAALAAGEITIWRHPPIVDDAHVVTADDDGDRLQVDVVRIPGLAIDAPDQFRQSIAEIGRCLAWINEKYPRTQLEVHLTGGFKATIPMIYALLEFLNGVRQAADRGESIVCYCKHQDSPQAVHLPLRREAHPCDLISDLQRGASDNRYGRFFVSAPRQRTPIGDGVLAMLEHACRPPPPEH